MKLNYKFVITAIFLISALLIAGCASNAAPAESLPPESASPAPFSDSNVSTGIQTGTDYEALLGTWTLDHAERTGEDAEPVPAESEDSRTYIFKEDGSGSVQYADSSDTFEYAAQGNVLTLVTDASSQVEMYTFSFNEDGALLLTRMNYDNSQQELVEVFVHPAE